MSFQVRFKPNPKMTYHHLIGPEHNPIKKTGHKSRPKPDQVQTWVDSTQLANPFKKNSIIPLSHVSSAKSCNARFFSQIRL